MLGKKQFLTVSYTIYCTTFVQQLTVSFLKLGIIRCPDASLHYEKRKKQMTHLLNRVFLNAIYVFSIYIFLGVLAPIVYLLIGNYDPKTWIVIFDKFV